MMNIPHMLIIADLSLCETETPFVAPRIAAMAELTDSTTSDCRFEHPTISNSSVMYSLILCPKKRSNS